MIYITGVHMVGGSRHEHIASVRWTNSASAQTGQSTRAAVVEHLTANPGSVEVHAGNHVVKVGVVKGTPRYIRTYADGVWTDNLLSLPRY